MLFHKTAFLVGTLAVGCLAAPANDLVARQGEGQITYTVTCIGPRCSATPPTSTPKTSTKISTSKYTTASPTPTPSKVSSEPASTVPFKRHIQPEVLIPTTKSTQQPSKTTQTEEVGPSSTRCPVPLYYQCGGYHDGQPWTGCTKCVSGAKCIWQNDWYYQCVADE